MMVILTNIYIHNFNVRKIIIKWRKHATTHGVGLQAHALTRGLWHGLRIVSTIQLNSNHPFVLVLDETSHIDPRHCARRSPTSPRIESKHASLLVLWRFLPPIMSSAQLCTAALPATQFDIPAWKLESQIASSAQNFTCRASVYFPRMMMISSRMTQKVVSPSVPINFHAASYLRRLHATSWFSLEI